MYTARKLMISKVFPYENEEMKESLKLKEKIVLMNLVGEYKPRREATTYLTICNTMVGIQRLEYVNSESNLPM